MNYEASHYARKEVDIAWCPGCGNFVILSLVQQALAELETDPNHVAVVSGIGQAAKTPHYLDVHMFNGLHGRALPVATALKAMNPELLVIAEGGDGDMYGEGGNHFLAAVRRNVNIVHIVHDNMVYGLTKGQASPTSQPGFTTPVQVNGVFNAPFNPIATAISLGGGFVSRVSTAHRDHAVAVIKEAILHPGYALVDIFQPCPSFNKLNTFQWFKEHVYELDGSHNSADPTAAFARAMEQGRFAIGVFYREVRESFDAFLWKGRRPRKPWELVHDPRAIQALFNQQG